MRTRTSVGAVLLAAVAALVWFLLRSAPPEDGSKPSSAAGSEQTAGASIPRNALLTAALPAPKGERTIRGRVVGPSGPVAGAVVVASNDGGEEVLSDLECQCADRCGQKLLQSRCPEAAAQLVDLVLQRRGEAPPVSRATSAEDGTFELRGLEENAFALWAEKPGELVGLRRGVQSGAEGVDVEVGPGTTLRGKTVTDDDRPVAGALVTAIYAEHARFFDTTSGPDGAFTLGPVPTGKLAVVASAPKLLPASGLVRAGDVKLAPLELYSPRRLAGRVVLQGAPSPGALVTLDGERKKLDVSAGADGSFSFSGLRPGRYGLAASTGFAQARAAVDLKEGKDVLDVVLDLGPGGEISGTVTASGAPVFDAKVTVTGTKVHTEQRTARDGTYRVLALRPGEYGVTAEAEGFVEPEREKVAVAEGSAATADFALQAASPLAGVVVDEAGNPVEDAFVQARLQGPERPARDDDDDDEAGPAQPRGAWGSARSKRDGAFLVDQVEAGRFDVVVSHKSFVDQEVQLTAPTTEARIVLARGAEVFGTVVEEDGKPVSGAVVSVYRDTSSRDRDRASDEERHTPKSQEGTGARGEFRVTGLEDGPHLVVASLGDYRGGRHVRRKVEVHSPSTGPVTLTFARGLSIKGTVLGKDGAPHPSTFVSAYLQREPGARPGEDLDRGYGSVEAAEDGTFEVEHLKAGSYRLMAHSRSGSYAHTREPVIARAGDVDVKLVLAGGGMVRGRVVRESGEPITFFKVDFREVRDAGGAFEVPYRHRAEGYMLFEAEGHAATRRKVESKDGADVDLGDVVLSKGRTVSGKVLDARTKAPLAGALVDVGGVELIGRPGLRNSLETGAVETRADGTFTLPHVETTPLGIFATLDGYRVGERPLGPGEDDVVLLLDPGAVVTGTVVDASGKPVNRAIVAAVGAKARLEAFTEKGRYRLDAVPPGKLTFAVMTRGDERYEAQTVEVPETGEVKLDFAPVAGGVTLVLTLPDPLLPLLVAGDVAAPARFEDLAALAAAALRPDRGEAGWTFQHVAPGAYSLFVLTRGQDRSSMQVAKQALTVGSEPEQRVAVPKPAAFTTLQGPAH